MASSTRSFRESAAPWRRLERTTRRRRTGSSRVCAHSAGPGRDVVRHRGHRTRVHRPDASAGGISRRSKSGRCCARSGLWGCARPTFEFLSELSELHRVSRLRNYWKPSATPRDAVGVDPRARRSNSFSGLDIGVRMSILTSLVTRAFANCLSHRFSGDRGAVSALAALAMVPIIAITAVGVDGGRVFVENQRIKTASEAGAMAAAADWVRSGTACGVSAPYYVAANADSSASSHCSAAGSRYEGVTTVDASKIVSAVFGSVIGHESTTVESSASVRVLPVGRVSGLRPTALCQDSPALVAWRASGFSTSQIFSVNFNDSCGGLPGNWGVLDFDGGSNRTIDLQEWINSGYPGFVSVGQEISGDPGIPSPALHMDSVVGRSITVPVYDTARLQGSIAIFRVSSFVRMDVISVSLSGAASARNVAVRFRTEPIAGAKGVEGNIGNGVVTWAPCQLDGRGACS